MGSCSTRDHEKQIDEEIQIELSKERKRLDVKCILFGTKNCGKTTIMKQLDSLLNNKQNNYEILINQIRQQCVNNFITLCHILFDTNSMNSLRELSVYKDEDLDKISCIISGIWKQQMSKIKYKFRHYYNTDTNCILDDNSHYFFDKIDQVMAIDYQPTASDIIYHKSCSDAIRQIPINWHSNGHDTGFGDRLFFHLIDSGNMDNRYEHRKLLRNVLFGYAEYIIFVASLSDYCCYESDEYETKNLMKQSLEYFDFIINSEHYRRFDVILIFTKMDIFQNCLKNGISVKKCFADDWSQGVNVSSTFIVPKYIRQSCGGMCIPQDLIVLIGEYVDEHGDDESFDEAFEFIKQQYLKQDKNYNYCRDILTTSCNTLDGEDVARTFQRIQKGIGHRSYTKTDCGCVLQIQGRDWPKWPLIGFN